MEDFSALERGASFHCRQYVTVVVRSQCTHKVLLGRCLHNFMLFYWNLSLLDWVSKTVLSHIQTIHMHVMFHSWSNISCWSSRCPRGKVADVGPLEYRRSGDGKVQPVEFDFFPWQFFFFSLAGLVWKIYIVINCDGSGLPRLLKRGNSLLKVVIPNISLYVSLLGVFQPLH